MWVTFSASPHPKVALVAVLFGGGRSAKKCVPLAKMRYLVSEVVRLRQKKMEAEERYSTCSLITR